MLEWLHQPETFDFSIRQIVEDLHAVAEGTQEGFELRVRIPNTDDCLSTGTHWFTVAYSVRIRDGASSVELDAMRERLLLDVRGLTAEEACEMHAAEMDYYAHGSAGSAEQSTREKPAPRVPPLLSQDEDDMDEYEQLYEEAAQQQRDADEAALDELDMDMD